MTAWQKSALIEKEGLKKICPCDLALMPLGFIRPQQTLSDSLYLEVDCISNYKANNYQTNKPPQSKAGDKTGDELLMVWAVSKDKKDAREVDQYLMGYTNLPIKDKVGLQAL